MMNHKIVAGLCCAVALALSGCSRQQSDWQKTRESNTTESYEQFLKKYPSGEFTAQAQARAKELYEERDWQKARDVDTPEAYQAFLKQYPEGKWTEEARIRVENFTLAQAPSGSGTPSVGAGTTNDVENAAPSGSPSGGAPSGGSPPGGSSPGDLPAGGAAPAVGVAATHRVAKTTKPAAGAYGVQLGAFTSGASAAHARWTQLQREFPSVLRGLTSKVSSKHTAAGSLYRLQAMGLTEKHARAICTSLAAKSQACLVIAAGHG